MKPTDRGLNEGQRVRAFFATTKETKAVGKVVAYSVKPQICVLTDDGERVWWSEDLWERIGVAFINGTVLRSNLDGELRIRIGERWLLADGRVMGSAAAQDAGYAEDLAAGKFELIHGGVSR